MQCPATIYDFHGTFADTSPLLHLLEERRWDDFYTASLDCLPNERVIAAAYASHELGHANVLYTGMSETYREGLIDWLIRYSVPIDHIRMRPKGDYRKDFILKASWYNEECERFDFQHAWEDSPAVVDLWRGAEIPTTVVPGYRSAFAG